MVDWDEQKKLEVIEVSVEIVDDLVIDDEV